MTSGPRIQSEKGHWCWNYTYVQNEIKESGSAAAVTTTALFLLTQQEGQVCIPTFAVKEKPV